MSRRWQYRRLFLPVSNPRVIGQRLLPNLAKAP